jgi:hypothetical protein
VKPVVEVASDWESYAYVELDLNGNEDNRSLRLRWLGIWRLMERNGSMTGWTVRELIDFVVVTFF